MSALDLQEMKAKVREFTTARSQETVMKKRKEEVRNLLVAMVNEFGEEDEKGNLVLDLDDEINGVFCLVNQRKIGRSLDGEVAEEMLTSILTETGTLWDDCVEWIPALDEDKVMAAHYDGLLTEQQVDEMFPMRESWAFTTPKR